jgi:hypothetical protein
MSNPEDARRVHTDDQIGASFLDQARWVAFYIDSLQREAKLSRAEAIAFARDMQVERFRSIFNPIKGKP